LLDLNKLGNRLPDKDQIAGTLSMVDYRKLVVDKDSVGFLQPNIAITLDGIAKGYIVDKGIDVLRRLGFTDVLVEAGGDLMGLGENVKGSPWIIGIQDPRGETGELIETIHLKDHALATSGDYMQTFTTDYQNHHIIDPHSGHSSLELASVSVMAPKVALADGFATAVMGNGEGGFAADRGVFRA
jgi:thiamine biosynthesis lipoprotein